LRDLLPYQDAPATNVIAECFRKTEQEVLTNPSYVPAEVFRERLARRLAGESS